MPTAQDAATYDAFISYRRRDGAGVAQWLRRRLQGFQAPRSMPGLRGRKLRVYLDTAYERGTHDFYEQTIRPALLASRHLVVIATPLAVAGRSDGSDWMRREIEDFAAGPHGRNILVVRGAGGDADGLPGDLAQRFPNMEVIDLRGAGRLSALGTLRSGRLSDELLKLVAPLLDVPAPEMPQLRMEEERRQQWQMGLVVGLAVSLVVLMTASAAVAVHGRNRAQAALGESLSATERVVAAVDGAFDVEADSQGARGQVLSQICDLRSRLVAEAPARASLAEHRVCELERARGFEGQKDLAQAEATLERAATHALERHDAAASADAAVAALAALWARQDLLDRHPSRPGRPHLAQEAARHQAAFDARWKADENYASGMEGLALQRAQLARVHANAALEQRDPAQAVQHWERAAAILVAAQLAKPDADRQALHLMDQAELQMAIAAFSKQRDEPRSRVARGEARRLLKTVAASKNLADTSVARAKELQRKLQELQ